MGLIAHWPLNGDLNDISGNDNHLYHSGATISGAGKIGECYYLAGSGVSQAGNWTSGEYLELPSEALSDIRNRRGTTYTFWINVDTDAADRISLLYGSGTIRHIEIYSGSKYFRTEAALTNGYSFGSGGFPDDVRGTWSHFAIVFDTSDPDRPVRWYQNGVLFYTHPSMNSGASGSDEYFSFSRIGQSTGSSTYPYAPSFKGKINDFRIYDHALTSKEVYEISKAKILHYTFNTFQEPTENLFRKQDLLEGGTSPYIIDYFGTTTSTSGHEGPFGDNNAIKLIGGDNPVIRYGRTDGTNTDITSGNTYTFSVYAKLVENSPTPTNFSLDIVDRGGSNQSSELTYSWKRFEVTATHDNSANYGFVDITISTNAEVYLANPQIEEKTYSTPFDIGIRGSDIGDVSGFGNNTSLVNSYTPKWSDDSDIGHGSYFFDNESSLNNYITKDSFYSPENITMSCWFKKTGDGLGTYHIPMNIDGAYHELSLSTTGNFRIGFYINGTRRTLDHSSSLYVDGNWHMFTGSFDGTTIRSYVDGNLVNSTSSYPGTLTQENRTLYIGRLGTSSTYAPNGYISDVRIYATALSDNDVTSMYEQIASRDKVGNVFLNDYNERIDYSRLLNDAIKNKTFTDGLSKYEQTYCKCTLTDDGYRIYRFPHIVNQTCTTVSSDATVTVEDSSVIQTGMEITGTGIPASTTVSSITNATTIEMSNPATSSGTNTITFTRNSTSGTWGGFLINVPEDAKQIGRSYRLQFRIKGQTNNDMSDKRFAYTPGWSTYGIYLTSHAGTTKFLTDMTDFQEEEYQLYEYEYTVDSNRFYYGRWNSEITSGSNVVTYTDKHVSAPDITVGDTLLPNAYFPDFTTVTGVTSDVSYTVSNNATASGSNVPIQTYRLWDTYRQLKIGFPYGLTGELGTDLYIKDLRIFDITDGESEQEVYFSKKSIIGSNILSTVGITDDMIGYWPLKDDFNDYSGNQNDGTGVDTGAGYIPELTGQSAVFENIAAGDGNYIATTLIPNTTTFTMMCKFKWYGAGGGGNHHLATYGDNSFNPQIVQSSGKIQFYANNFTSVLSADPINSNQWYHIAYVIKQIDTDTNIKVYLDGEIVIDSTQTAIIQTNQTNPFSIGVDYDGSAGTDTFRGEISDMKFFNSDLSQEEIMIESDILNSEKKMKKAKDGTLYISGDVIEGL